MEKINPGYDAELLFSVLRKVVMAMMDASTEIDLAIKCLEHAKAALEESGLSKVPEGMKFEGRP